MEQTQKNPEAKRFTKIKVGLWNSELTKNYTGWEELGKIYTEVHSRYLSYVKDFLERREQRYEVLSLTDRFIPKDGSLKNMVDVVVLPYVMVIDDELCYEIYRFAESGGGILVLNGAIGARATKVSKSDEGVKRFTKLLGLKEDATGQYYHYIGAYEKAEITHVTITGTNEVVPRRFLGHSFTPHYRDADVYLDINTGIAAGTLCDNLGRKFPALICNRYGEGRTFTLNFNPHGLLEENHVVETIMDNALEWLSNRDKMQDRAKELKTEAGKPESTPNKAISVPIARLINIDHPSEVHLGDYMEICVEAENAGSEAAWQTISVSFPQKPEDVSIVEHNLYSAYISNKVWPLDKQVSANYGLETVRLKYPLVEGFKRPWKSGEKGFLKVKVKPEISGDFTFNIRSVSGRQSDEKCVSWDPATGTTDQQDEYVYTRTIKVSAKPLPYFPKELLAIYSPIEQIGEGGFARVFKAKRKSDSKTVAVKIPLSLDAATGKTFVKEIRVWEDLKHENIAECYDCNVLPIPYLELEYADGGSLEDLPKPVAVEEATRIALGIARGLKYAHHKQPVGIIHRDLKPGNILLTSDLTPKITDWGLSKVAAESRTISLPGFSPLYAAPEQISPKKFGTTDHRTDIYQLGLILYELVTGRLPFSGEDITELMAQIVSEEPQKPSEVNPALADIEPIIVRCLARRKEERYQDVQEIEAPLSACLKKRYGQSFKESRGDMTRSAYYCAQLFLLHVRLCETAEALQYCHDLRSYTAETDDVDEMTKELQYRLKNGPPIDDEFYQRAKVVAHRIILGQK